MQVLACMVRRTILLSQFCPSATLVIHAWTVHYIEIYCAPYDRVMFLAFGTKFRSLKSRSSLQTIEPKSDNLINTPR